MTGACSRTSALSPESAAVSAAVRPPAPLPSTRRSTAAGGPVSLPPLPAADACRLTKPPSLRHNATTLPQWQNHCDVVAGVNRCQSTPPPPSSPHTDFLPKQENLRLGQR